MEINPTRKQALQLLRKTPPLSYATIGRVLGLSRQRIQEIAEDSEVGPARRREALALRRLAALARANEVTTAAIRKFSSGGLKPNELEQLADNLSPEQTLVAELP
jgi:hypothetical protein